MAKVSLGAWQTPRSPDHETEERLLKPIRRWKPVRQLCGPVPADRSIRFLPGPKLSVSRPSLAHIFASGARHLLALTLSCAGNHSDHAQADPLFSSGQRSWSSTRRTLFAAPLVTD